MEGPRPEGVRILPFGADREIVELLRCFDTQVALGRLHADRCDLDLVDGLKLIVFLDIVENCAGSAGLIFAVGIRGSRVDRTSSHRLGLVRQSDLCQLLRLRSPADLPRNECGLLLRGAHSSLSRVVICTFVDFFVALDCLHGRRRTVILLLIETYRILQILKGDVVRIQNRLQLLLLHLPKRILVPRRLLHEWRIPHTRG